MEGLPSVVMAMSLSISPKTETLKLATHGNGVYESVTPLSLPANDYASSSIKRFYLSPNPTTGNFEAFIDLEKASVYELFIRDLHGQLIFQSEPVTAVKGTASLPLTLLPYPAGTYLIELRGRFKQDQRSFSFTRKLVKF